MATITTAAAARHAARIVRRTAMAGVIETNNGGATAPITIAAATPVSTNVTSL
jgi:hypothetical protein